MPNRLHGVRLNRYRARGKRVFEIATGKVVHRAPNHKAAKDVARRMHGVMVPPRWSLRAA